MKKIAIFIALCFVVICGAKAQTIQERGEAFEQEMQAFCDEIGVVGMSTVVVIDNKIVYNHNFGLKDIEAAEPVTDQTMFRIASISKSFSATSMMQLIEEGKVTLDTDVSELAGFKIRNPKYPDTVITLEMLLSHTSSLNDSQGYFNFDGINPETNPDWAKCYNRYEPGKGYQYCNLNFNLVGSFIEKLSGERFDQYVVNHVLKPLNLYGGYCVDSLDTSRFAKLYSWNGKEFVEEKEAYEPRSEAIAHYRTGYDTPLFSPTGGMKISALDLARYMMMHMNYGKSPITGARIMSKKSSKNMQTERSERAHYCFALEHSDLYAPVTLTGHTGGAYGLRSAMFFDPEKKFGFVVICNGCKNPWAEKRNVLQESVNLMYKNFIGNTSK